MGYPEQGAHLDPNAAVRHFDRTAGFTQVANGRTSPLTDATSRADLIAQEARELILRGHQALDRIAGSSEESSMLAKTAGGPIGVPREDRTPALEHLSDAITRNGHSLDPLRALVNRLEAL